MTHVAGAELVERGVHQAAFDLAPVVEYAIRVEGTHLRKVKS